MEFKREKTIALWLITSCFVIGVICYAALPLKSPDEPVRIMFQATAGKVLFSHKMHTSEDWYGFECVDCHHTFEGGEGEVPVSCSECHYKEGGEELIRADALHDQCIGCHEDMGSAPVDCSVCHIL